MSLYVYAPKLYPGTRELIEKLQAKRLLMHDGMRFLNRGVPIDFKSSDVIICWGQHVPPVDGVTMLNASFQYTDQISINTRLGKILKTTGLAAFDLMPMLEKEYVAELQRYQAFKNGSSKKKKYSPLNGMVPFKEFYGYGSRTYTFSKITKLTMFGGEALTNAESKDVSVAQTTMKALGLDFAVLTFGMVGEIYVLIKVITAPELDKNGVDLYAKHISEKANSVVGQSQMLEEMRKMLEE